ncbi:MAG: radical SAM protein [Clostridia bacterium]
MKHVNVALFVPDEGCPHRCSFCNQKVISGVSEKLTEYDIEKAVEIATQSKKYTSEGEIAFFGGSFTAIETQYMVSLLKKANEYITQGLFRGVRISTRPDCINEEVLQTLKKYNVKAIELGCQSMNDKVLEMNTRGHSELDVYNAARLIKAHGFELGVQMMTGLYGDSDETCLDTARKLIELKPNTARIYPTIVLEQTKLAELLSEGKYKAQTTEEAVDLCSKLLLMFDKSNIPVIRLGLHSGGSVVDGYIAGAYHEAFRELCESKIYFDKVLQMINDEKIKVKKLEITVGAKFVSQLIGQKKSNLIKLQNLGFECQIIQNPDLKKYEINVRGITK